MDVLRPPTTWINGICYRKNPKSLISFKTDEDDENAITADEFTSSAAGYDEVGRFGFHCYSCGCFTVSSFGYMQYEGVVEIYFSSLPA